MIISDLNYLEVANEEICGGSGFFFHKDVKTNVRNRLDVKKRVLSKVRIKGNLADAESYADAYGDNSLTETLTVTYADDYGSSSYSDAKSAVD